MSLGGAIESLAAAENIVVVIDDGQVKGVLANLIEAIRELGEEVEKIVRPVMVVGTDYGVPPCLCSVRTGTDPGPGNYGTWIVTWNSSCPVHREDISRIIDMVEAEECSSST